MDTSKRSARASEAQPDSLNTRPAAQAGRSRKEIIRGHDRLALECVFAINRRDDATAWINTTRTVKTEYGWQRFGIQKGGADILCCVRLRSGAGAWLGLEVKTGEGEQSADQKLFQARLERFGGVYRVVRSTDEALIAVESVIDRGLF